MSKRPTLSDIDAMCKVGGASIKGFSKQVPVKDSLEVQPKPSKYRNKRIVHNGIKFDSIRESEDYGKLLILERQGMITDLKRQVNFELNPGGTFSYKYKADFTYYRNGEFVVQDSKGCRTAVYKKKKKLMKKVFNITILET